MKRVIRRTITAVIVGALAVTAGVFASKGSQPTMEVVTEQVRTRDLVQTVEATGSVESADEAELSFDVSGDVKDIYVKVGDRVEADQILAVLDTTELAADAENARKAVEAAQANLAAKNAGNTNETLAVSQSSVAVAEASLASAKIDEANATRKLATAKTLTEASVLSAEASASTRRTSLANARTDAAQDAKEAGEDMITSMFDAAIAVRGGLSDADSVLGVDNTLANNDFQGVLSIIDDAARVAAERAYGEAKLARDRMEAAVFPLLFSASVTDASVVIPLVEDALKKTETTLLETRRALDATVVDTADFSFADLNALKSRIDTARVNVQAKRVALLAARQNADRARIDGEANVANAQRAAEESDRALEQAKADRANAVVAAESALSASASARAVQEASVAEARARLSEVAARPRPVDVAALAAEVDRARAAFSASLARLAKAEIRAPIAGTVTAVEVEPGELAGPSIVAVTVESDGDRFNLVMDLAESDVTKVRKGNRSDVTFDAFGDDVIVTGEVKEVDPAEKLVEGVVFYEATVDLTHNVPPAGLKPGMSADVTITTAERSDVIAVPQRAVLEHGQQKYVRVLENGVIVERDVHTGLRADGGFVEILSGLREGETLVVTVRT